MTILVTGATGHIGNVLIKQLIEKGFSVRAFVHPSESLDPLEGANVEIVRGDILDYPALLNAVKGAEIVYHLAAIITILPGKHPQVHKVNVEGTRNAIRACKEAGTRRLVYTSSIHAFARVPHGQVIDETVPYDPENPYGAYDQSKAQATLEVLQAAKDGLDAVVACPTGVIGPYDYRDSLMGNSIRTYTKDTKEHIYIESSGYDFVDVRDVAAGLIAIADKGRAGESYLLSGEYIASRDLVQLVCDLRGKKTPIKPLSVRRAHLLAKIMPLIAWITNQPPQMTPYSVEVMLSNANISHAKAERELGYQPRSLRESVADALTWYEKHGKI